MKLAAFLVATMVSAAALAAASTHPVLEVLNTRSAGSPARYAKAAARVVADARKGLRLQRYLAALLAADERLPEEASVSEEERLAWLEETRPKIIDLAEKRGNPLAWYLRYLETGSEEFLDKAVEGGNVQAMNSRGTKLMVGALENPGAEGSGAAMKESFRLFSMAAEKGDANAKNNVGICFLKGYGCERNPAMALECFKEAAKSEHPEAMDAIAEIYRTGAEGVKADSAEAAVWMMRAKAAKGDQNAARWLEAAGKTLKEEE